MHFFKVMNTEPKEKINIKPRHVIIFILSRLNLIRNKLEREEMKKFLTQLNGRRMFGILNDLIVSP